MLGVVSLREKWEEMQLSESETLGDKILEIINNVKIWSMTVGASEHDGLR